MSVLMFECGRAGKLHPIPPLAVHMILVRGVRGGGGSQLWAPSKPAWLWVSKGKERSGEVVGQ
jgi:hypothetical protein